MQILPILNVKKNKAKKKSIKVKIYFFLIIIFGSITFLLFKDLGLLTYFEFLEQNKEIELEIATLEKEIEFFNKEINNLNQAKSKELELEARKKQIFKKDGERVYRLKEMKTFKKIK